MWIWLDQGREDVHRGRRVAPDVGYLDVCSSHSFSSFQAIAPFLRPLYISDERSVNNRAPANDGKHLVICIRSNFMLIVRVLIVSWPLPEVLWDVEVGTERSGRLC